MGPRPARGSIPIWVGGHSPAALARAARYGEAWISPGGSAAGFPELVRKARAAFAENGRTESPKLVSMAYVAFGNRRDAAVRYMREYYSHVGAKAEFLANAVISDGAQLKDTIDGFRAAGCDELILHPCTGDSEQVGLLADVALA